MTIDWRELKNKIYYLDGSLRDIYIHGTTRDDWQKWVDFVNENLLKPSKVLQSDKYIYSLYVKYEVLSKDFYN